MTQQPNSQTESTGSWTGAEDPQYPQRNEVSRSSEDPQLLCSRCRKDPPRIGKRRCEKCAEYARAIDRTRRASGYYSHLWRERLAAGLCGYCGQRPHEDGKARCKECLEKDALIHEISKRRHT